MFGKKENTEPDYEYFAIYDSKVQHYRIPMPAINRFDMIRQIEGLFRDPQQVMNDLYSNAEDFQLFKIGEFYKKTGEMVHCTKEHIANLHEIKASIQKPVGALSST